jgi:LemA protein
LYWILAIVGFIGLGILLAFIAIYNGLVRLKNNIKKALGNIDVLLKQRGAELPKLVSVCKGYMKHERGTLENITKARTAWANAKTIQQKAAADNQITGALKTLFAVAENYPNLKANENFQHLQTRVTGLENEIADRREFYNDSVNQFNIRIQSIPDVFVARTLGYKAQTLFEATAEEKKDVKIEF